MKGTIHFLKNYSIKLNHERMSSRWYFKVNHWQPTKEELLKISTLIQPEEKIRIARFHFMKDAKSSLIGRLLMRKLISIQTQTENHSIELGRDDRNKPILLKPPSKINFNVSHQGNYVVLATDSAVKQLGIDVMNIEKPGARISQSVDEYFQLMRSTFTDNEWNQIKGESGNSSITNFTRFWCLKESYVKATGLGIVIDLRSVDFCTKSDLEVGSVLTNTQVQVDGELKPKWTFEERFLDNQHIVAVAKEGTSPVVEFQEQHISFLMDSMTPLCNEDGEWAETFLKKQIRLGE